MKFYLLLIALTFINTDSTFNIKEVEFCSVSGKEKFSITSSSALKKMSDTIEFTIVSHAGSLLYSDTFQAIALIDLSYTNNIEPIEYAKQRLDNFLSDNHFSELNTLDKFDSDYSSEKNWNCVMNQNKLRKYFEYKLYDEYWKRISYCDNENRIILFWECC